MALIDLKIRNEINKYHFLVSLISISVFFSRLQELFKPYKEQLEKDLDAIVSHDEESLKAKRKKQTSDNSTDKRTEKINAALIQVMYCLQPAVRSSIAVFNLNSDENLSETIFRTICKCEKFNLEENKEHLSFLKLFYNFSTSKIF